MPLGPIKLVSPSPHAMYPLYIQETPCHTAEIPSGANTGARAQHTAAHFMHYRLGGPHHFSPITGAGDTGTLYLIVHTPDRRDSATQNLFVDMVITPTDDTGWTVEWRETFGSGAYTALWSGEAATDIMRRSGIIAYTPPTGTGSNSIKCLEIHYDNLKPLALSAYALGDKYTLAADVLVEGGECSNGRTITDQDNSLNGLIKSIGTGADDVESIERWTRRVFFNQTHPDGSQLQGSDVDATWCNMFTEFQFPAQGRGLIGDTDVYAYPAAVISCDGHDEGADVQVRFIDTVSAEEWIYEVQAGDPVDTPFLIHPWRTGSSSASGLLIPTSTTGAVEVQGWCTDVGSAGEPQGELLVKAWALFEGPAY